MRRQNTKANIYGPWGTPIGLRTPCHSFLESSFELFSTCSAMTYRFRDIRDQNGFSIGSNSDPLTRVWYCIWKPLKIWPGKENTCSKHSSTILRNFTPIACTTAKISVEIFSAIAKNCRNHSRILNDVSD